jgi:hypothetical protein
MTTKEACDHFNGPRGLAEFLGIWPHNISRWGEHPPKERQYELEVRTNGALKAERK